MTRCLNNRSPNGWWIFGLEEKAKFFMLNCCGYFLSNFCKNLSYFLIPHLVTLLSIATKVTLSARRTRKLFKKQENQYEKSEQCDQIWRNFATLAKFWKALAILKGLFGIWQTFVPNLVNLYCNWAKFLWGKWPKYWKSNVVIWSHWGGEYNVQERYRMNYDIWPWLILIERLYEVEAQTTQTIFT